MNREIAIIFDEIADLLEITGGDRFRINSYRRVSRIIDELPESVADLLEKGKLQKIPGIGKGTIDRIQEYLSKGKISTHQELLTSVPAGLLDLLRIPSLGPKKAHTLHQELGVKDIDSLQKAIAKGKVEKLDGFGKKSVEKILEGIEFLERSAGRTPLGIARPVAEILAQTVAEFAGVKKVEIAGSVRRGKETIGDLDLLCVAADGFKTIKTFTKIRGVTEVVAAGKTKGSVVVANPLGGEIQVDLRVVSKESLGAALQYFTGSKEHNVRLRELAINKGWKLNEYGLFKGDEMIAGKDEAGIYKKLGLKFIPPELREDRGEIECKGNLPDLIGLDDIQGDLHVHCTASDGRNTVEQLAAAAQKRGYKYIGITDHSKSSAIANGLSADELLESVENIRKVNKKLKGVAVLAGTEVDILADGSLDYPDKVLAKLDWVIASIHSAQGQGRDRITKRSIAALENPYVHALGHPSGRLLGQRDAMDLDWEKVISKAAQTNTALELNCSWQRLDLNDLHVRQAMEAGCWIVICTDAHDIEQLGQIDYGIQTARRGWATKSRVLNAMPITKIKKWLSAKHGG
ncbi:MAG: DNA polymerase/3'-5' exonuclease PolX [Planctomycetota bacterium]|nr:MAG: DNA polymerase/3'-5' exonuclease PolX [Planctomycetota bacterium]